MMRRKGLISSFRCLPSGGLLIGALLQGCGGLCAGLTSADKSGGEAVSAGGLDPPYLLLTTETSAKPQLLPRNPMIETAANISSARSLPFAKMLAQKKAIG